MAQDPDGGGPLDVDLDAPDPVDEDGAGWASDAPCGATGAAEAPGTPSAVHRRQRRQRRGVVVAVVLVVAALVVTAVVRRDRVREEQAAASRPVTAEQLFPVLAQPAASSDAVDPPLAAAHDVVDGSSRRVTVDSGLVFWAARDSSGGVCLLVRTESGPLRLGGACTSLRDAAARGVALPGGDGVAAVLLPAGLDGEDVAGAQYSEIASGLWVDLATARRAACAGSLFGSGC